MEAYATQALKIEALKREVLEAKKEAKKAKELASDGTRFSFLFTQYRGESIYLNSDYDKAVMDWINGKGEMPIEKGKQ